MFESVFMVMFDRTYMIYIQVFTATYSITSEALMYPFNDNTLGDTIFHAGKRAYLNVFGDINIKGFDNNMLEGFDHGNL